ncbi:tRNA(Met) cytidine acetate ligase [Dysosmobacter sp.]|uniref:tRNA(Met) cytidine acetate ligase n=1 Tax=Dysosmobacter sp. TaxID=2591382 RepID=UPI002A851162|nr:nucleotidyltransferase family protein [Dysosmobacter sp.]MDY3281570.1 nucleotidyltransferase family protein [Dysosmobacter sp.]
MQIAGIITEYNPLHAGHLYQIARTRQLLGEDAAVICVMSGSFVQRGDFALVRKHARAEAAVRSGADLVLELPLPWAVSSAEGFAHGGVRTLLATGLVTHLSFGSECGDASVLRETAAALLSPEYQAGLQRLLGEGKSYAACRQAVTEALIGPEKAACLARPNDNLGVEYCKALLRCDSPVQPIAVRREGAGHDSQDLTGTTASAGAIRRLLREGRREEALACMAPAMRQAYWTEEAAGRAPVRSEACERAILARLRSMTRAEFQALDTGKEGLGNRLFDAARQAASLEDLLAAAKTKRYAHARLRRMVLWAFLGLTPADVPDTPPYVRVLAANDTGRELLARMRRCAAVPVLTRPADARTLSPEARRLFDLEVRATDLYTLAYPDLSAALPGAEWREGPVIL